MKVKDTCRYSTVHNSTRTSNGSGEILRCTVAADKMQYGNTLFIVPLSLFLKTIDVWNVGPRSFTVTSIEYQILVPLKLREKQLLRFLLLRGLVQDERCLIALSYELISNLSIKSHIIVKIK